MTRILLVVCSVILLNLELFGFPGRTMASDSLLHLHVDSDRLTGRLTHMTLHEVLGQLHDQLGIDYVVPDAELEKIISVTLQKEPVSMALSKILARWDYAFTVNTAGKIKTLYVMAKVPPEELVPEATNHVEAMEEPYGEDVRELSNAVQEDQRSAMSREHPFQQHAPLSELHARESAGSKPERSPGLVPMEIRPPVLGASMPILPANQKNMGDVTGEGTFHNMEIIPPTAYPPMNIQPVPEHVQQEMLLTLNP
jgi:hypothetical protein